MLNILKLIFAGAPLAEVLSIIVRLVEAQGDGMLNTIFLLDKDGKGVRCATAPSLPGFIPAVGRIPVGQQCASCGTAIYRRAPVYATDIMTDPLWDDYRHLLVPFGLRAVWARPLLSSEGKVLGTFATYYRDVRSPSPTDLRLIENASHIAGIAIERHLYEEQLSRSETFLAEAQRLSSTGSFCWKTGTDEITWSDEVYRIFEFDRDTPVTVERIADRIHPADLPEFRQQVERFRRDGGDMVYDHRLEMADRSVKYLHLVAHGTRNDRGHWEYVGAIQDFTQRRLSEQALSKVQSELAHVARVTSLGLLTASIAHEVNQPLSGIITNASTGLRMLAADPPNVDGARDTLRRTLRDGNRASDVITRLRALFSKKETTVELVDVNEAIREVVALSLSNLHRDRVTLRLELADRLPSVTGDRVQLQQVILNLLLNAADAMSQVDDRPRDLTIRTAGEEGDQVRVTVRDTGIGIASHDLERLFEAFYTTKTDGMGMGLSVSRAIIEQHCGRMWATPNDGPGATFGLSLPTAMSALPPEYCDD